MDNTDEFFGSSEPQDWWSYGFNNGGSPVVIKRKLGYVVTALTRLSAWEAKLAKASAAAELDRHPRTIENLTRRVERARARVDYSAQVLRNCVRFALARIDEGPDQLELIEKRRAAAEAEIAEWAEEDRRIATAVILDHRPASEVAEEFDLSVELVRQKRRELRKRLTIEPYVKQPGHGNKAWHEELRYYAKVLDSYLLAKTAVAGVTGSSEALQKIWRNMAGAIQFYKMTSGRELDDAGQQAALGLLEACKEFQPGKDGKLAQLSTFANWKVRRSTQVRRASHCKPGQTLLKDRITATLPMEPKTDGDGRPDSFHPSRESDEATRMDVAAALGALSEEDREIALRVLQGGERPLAVAAEKGLTHAQIRYKINKIKDQLRAKLGGHAPEQDEQDEE